jgi:hypothetical protein
MPEEEGILLPDGSVLPPGYVPGDVNDPPPQVNDPNVVDEFYDSLSEE